MDFCSTLFFNFALNVIRNLYLAIARYIFIIDKELRSVFSHHEASING